MSSDYVRYRRIPGFPGVEILTARYSKQRFSRHFHDCYAVGVIESGALGFDYLGERLTAAAGDVNLAVPGEPHTGYPAAEGGWTYRMLYLSPDLVAEAASSGPRCGTGLPFFRAGVLRDAELGRTIRSFHSLCASGPVDPLEAETVLALVVRRVLERVGAVEASRPPRGTEPRRPGKRARMASEYLEENSGRRVTLKELSGEADSSPYHLIRTFEAGYGLPPHAYLAQLRVGKAKDLIARGASLADAAQEAGFADQSHMNRLFRRILGLTPGDYRNFIQDA